jgi:ATPase associated with various cellular activities AAA_5
MIRNDKTLGKASDEIIKRLENLNLCILSIQGLSNAYQIGAAYFLKLKNYLKDDNSIAPESWESLWKNHIHGLLFEYLRGFPDAQESLNQLYEAFQLKSTYSQVNGKVIKS